MTKFLRYLAAAWLCAVACCIMGLVGYAVWINPNARWVVVIGSVFLLTVLAGVFVTGGFDND